MIVSKVSEDGTAELELLLIVELLLVVKELVVDELGEDKAELVEDIELDDKDELEVVGETVVVCELEVVVDVDFTLEIARYAPPAAIKMMTITTTTISPTLLSPAFNRFKLPACRSIVS